ncbi:uncharacterized transposon-derived [Paramuricea clavata]|uniref:Uncharacterized transposon-derived n=1 Tax=Paramuricea clavata TaxID=317549 RepID=A0A6S7GGJ9_PARCT|nr:uncharacterized transposon-derived [Paramuricea clavata]
MSSKNISRELIKKAARLLKGEKLTNEQQAAYRLHAQKRVKYKRLKIHVTRRNQQWSIDLADLNNLSRYNNQYRYMLVCVDVYSRYGMVKLLKTKSARNVANKFEELLREYGVPEKVQSDEGTEFSIIKRDLAPRYGFQLFSTFNRETKAVHAERFIRTFKEMVLRSLTTLNLKYCYVDYLPIVIERYNESPHAGIFDATPHDVYIRGKSLNTRKLLKRMLNKSQPTRNLLHEGDRVRLSRVKNNIFEKSTLQCWVREKFIVYKVLITDPVTYELRDEKGEKIKGIFYREELQKI